MTNYTAQRLHSGPVALNFRLLFFCACLGVVATTGCVASDISSSSVEQSKIDPFAVELVSQRCAICHQLSTVTDRRASAEEWHEIVQRMLLYGAQLNDEEKNIVVDYLSDQYDQSEQN